jgi:hypothetical protein
MGLFIKIEYSVLDLVYSDSALRTYFNTGLTTETFICLYWLCFTVYHLENLSWACCYTFFVAAALVFINYYFKHELPP